MVPSEFVLYFDCRIPFERMDVDELEPTMDQWCHDVSNSVLIDYTLQELPINPTRINDPYWVTFEKAVEEVYVFVPKRSLKQLFILERFKCSQVVQTVDIYETRKYPSSVFRLLSIRLCDYTAMMNI